MINRQSFPSLIVMAISVAYLVVAIVPLCSPSTLWGISHLYYLGWPARMAVLLGSLLIAIVALAVGTRPQATHRATNALLYVVVPMTLLVVFYLLRVKTHYLGDGILRAREIEFGLRLIPTEPLGHYLNYLGHSIFSALFGWAAIQSIEALSLLAGVAFYFAALYLARTLFTRAEDVVLAFIALYFSGTALQFCGYVESYSLAPMLIAIYVASGIRALENRGSAQLPIRLYLLLALYHLQFLYFVPTLLFIAYRQYRQGALANAVTGVIFFLLSIATAIAIPMMTGRSSAGVGAFLIALTQSSPYWLLSGRHLLDIMNQLLLTAIVPIILIVTLVFIAGKRLFALQPRLLFVGLLLPGAIAFISLLQPELGYASDWDLFSSAGVVLGVVALTFYSLRDDFNLSRLARTMLATAAITSFISFAAVNSDADTAIARQIDILSIAGEQGAVGFETLGTDLSKSGNKELAEQMWKRSAELRPHARVLGNLGQLALLRHEFAEAESYLRRSLALDSTRAIVHQDLGLTYAWQGQFALGESYLRKAVALGPNDAKLNNNLAVFLSQHGTLAEAESYSRNAVALQPENANYATTLGTFLARQGNNSEAERFLLQAISSQPDFANAYINLAAIYRSVGETEKARQLLSDYLARYPNRPDSEKIRQALGENP